MTNARTPKPIPTRSVAQFRMDWPAGLYNPRWIAWCWMTDRMPGTFRPTAFFREYAEWIRENKRPGTPGVSDHGDTIIDHDRFTDHLWQVAKLKRKEP